MKYQRFVLGPLENNCYLVYQDKKALIVDASGGVSGAQHIQEHITENKLKLESIYITHGHFDHIDAAMKLAELSGAEVYLNTKDTFLWRQVYQDQDPTELTTDEITLNDTGIKVLTTPGHTPGSTCYYTENLSIVFTGDTLFAGGPGATRWNYSSMQTLIDSIERQLFTLPDNTVVLPGHGDQTTIRKEKNTIRKLRSALDTMD